MIESIRANNPGPFTLDGTRSWIIDGQAIVDPGPDDEEHIARLVNAAPRLETIFITHRHADHAPAALPLKEQTRARIIAPAGCLDPNHVDVVLEDEATFHLGSRTIRAIATPGHTAEHFCFLTDRRELFTGDTVLGEGTTAIFPPDGEMSSYLRSLQRLLELDPVILYPGHGPERTDAREWIRYYIHHRQERMAQILDAIGEAPRNLPELRKLIYPELDPALHPAAETQLLAHLIHFEQMGSLRRENDRWAGERAK